jgi:2-polyprenyl-6-methoxyphenol hydroxylase-like FAD-dependent oxidoreductase
MNIYHRHDLLTVFYNTLPDAIKAKILTSKKVTTIDTLPSSVRVTCADGTSYTGSIVLGADGVHSTVRSLMQPLSPRSTAPPSLLTSLLHSFTTPAAVDDAAPFAAAYRVLFGSFPRVAVGKPLAERHVYESHGPESSSQLFVGARRAWFFVYEKLDAPTRERHRYGQQDADEVAQRHADMHVTPELTLGEAYATKLGSGLTDLEEGIVSSWAAGRAVLVGDAAHKLTPNMGWGFNTGVMDVVALVNPLRKLVQAGDGNVKDEDIFRVFREYQAERLGFMTTVKELSGSITRASTWASWPQMVLDHYVFPLLGADNFVLRRILGPKIAEIKVLDWLDEEHYAEGSLPWKHLPKQHKEKAEAKVRDWFSQVL